MSLVRTILYVYVVIILGRVLLSWFPLQPGSLMAQIYRFLVRLTEPVLGPLRRVLPRLGMIDLSPLVALLLIQVVIALLPQ